MADKKNLANGELSEEELDQAVGGVSSAQMKGIGLKKTTIVSATESIDAQLKAGAQIASATEIAASTEIEGNSEVSASALQQIKNATAVKPNKKRSI